MSATDRAVDEGAAFLARHPDLPEAVRPIGALTWGLWRALYACPAGCAATMAPADGLEAEARYWRCPTCGGVWERRDAPEAPAKVAKRRGRRG